MSPVHFMRVTLFVLTCLLFATAAGACEICDDESHQGERTHIWCDFPPDNSWGFDECSMRTTPDGGETCWTGTSMCYYTERRGGGDGGGDGGTGGGGGDDTCNSGGYCPAWCAVCNLEP